MEHPVSKTVTESDLAQLRARVSAQRAERSRAAESLKACAEEVLGVPAGAIAASGSDDTGGDDTQDSGIRSLPTARAVQIRRQQVEQSRIERQAAMARLKRTTTEAVRVVGETTLMDADEVRRRVAGKPPQ